MPACAGMTKNKKNNLKRLATEKAPEKSGAFLLVSKIIFLVICCIVLVQHLLHCGLDF
jgi:hypothetical protein